MAKRKSSPDQTGATDGQQPFLQDMDFSEATFSPLWKAYGVAKSIRKMMEMARGGDATAIKFVFRVGCELAECAVELARNPMHRGKVEATIEDMLAVPAFISVQPGLEARARKAYSSFKIGKMHKGVLRAEWDFDTPASRTMAGILSGMGDERDRARATPKSQWSALEKICGPLPSTRSPDLGKRKKACAEWRDAFVKFVPALSETQGELRVKLSELPGFAGYAARNANDMTGMKEQILRFCVKYLYV